MTKIFAVVVTYNGMRWYDRCLSSLRDSELPVETIVVDNASTDGTLGYIRQHFPQVSVLESGGNVGFAKANNIGIRYALDRGADYVFLLNQDAWVEKGTMATLVRTFEDNGCVGIASPIHLNGSYSGVDRHWLMAMQPDCLSDLFMRQLQPYYEVPFVNAAAWLISRECLQTVGGFDTLLFRHYGEDDNYCQRVRYHKLRVVINTQCTICHDREDRDASVDTTRIVWKKKNLFLETKAYDGDINRDFDYVKKCSGVRLKALKSLLMLSIVRYRSCREELTVYRDIAVSRQQNMKTGETWL